MEEAVMATGTYNVICAHCRVPLQGNVVDTKPEDRFACPSCGQGDTYQNIMREAKDSATEQVGEAFTKMIKDTLRGSKYLKFTEKRRPKKAHRFILDMNSH
jgi:hypothetical protein